MLAASTFLGSRLERMGSETATVIALDRQNNVVVAGETRSPNFPTTVGAYDPTHNGRSDAFVAKLSSDLKTLLAATFFGRKDHESITAFTFDSQNNLVVTGNTYSSDFPNTQGAYDITYDGRGDVFIAKLSGDLSALHAATFLGGTKSDEANAVTVDRQGNIIATGQTWSLDFPTMAEAYDSNPDVRSDAFVAKLSSNLKTLLAVTFIGGSDWEIANKLVLDNHGSIMVAGFTISRDFPTTIGSYNTKHNGLHDVFVARLSDNLTTLENATFFGGEYNDLVTALALDDSGHVWIAGNTQSPDFPTTAAAYDQTPNGGTDVFVARLSKTLTTLENATFLGGRGDDLVTALALDNSGNVWIAGNTQSPDFPTTVGAYDPTPNGGTDVFVARLSKTLTTLENATFLGGILFETATGLVLNVYSDILVTGWTISPDFPTTVKSYDPTYNGDQDVFIARITFISQKQMTPVLNDRQRLQLLSPMLITRS